jgi:hypothetical protein
MKTLQLFAALLPAGLWLLAANLLVRTTRLGRTYSLISTPHVLVLIRWIGMFHRIGSRHGGAAEEVALVLTTRADRMIVRIRRSAYRPASTASRERRYAAKTPKRRGGRSTIRLRTIGDGRLSRPTGRSRSRGHSRLGVLPCWH